MIPLNESLESKYRKRITKGGVLKDHQALKYDIKQYNDAVNSLRGTLFDIELDRYLQIRNRHE